MLSGFDASLDERLRRAEEAEGELVKLEPVAAEAPRLRLEKAKVQKRQERDRAKESAMQVVRPAVRAASEKQTGVPHLLEIAGQAVRELYTVVHDIDCHRREAIESLAIVDRIDYEIEVEDGEEHEIALDRDPRGLAYALAARHGDPRVRDLLEELDPEFAFLKNCDLTETLYRDVAKFIIEHAVSSPNTELEAMEEESPGTLA